MGLGEGLLGMSKPAPSLRESRHDKLVEIVKLHERLKLTPGDREQLRLGRVPNETVLQVLVLWPIPALLPLFCGFPRGAPLWPRILPHPTEAPLLQVVEELQECGVDTTGQEDFIRFSPQQKIALAI